MANQNKVYLVEKHGIYPLGTIGIYDDYDRALFNAKVECSKELDTYVFFISEVDKNLILESISINRPYMVKLRKIGNKLHINFQIEEYSQEMIDLVIIPEPEMEISKAEADKLFDAAHKATESKKVISGDDWVTPKKDCDPAESKECEACENNPKNYEIDNKHSEYDYQLDN